MSAFLVFRAENLFWNIINTSGSKVSEIVSTVINFVSELPGKIWNSIVGAISTVASWGGQLLSAGINAAQNLVNGIWNTICELPGKMLNIGGDLVRGLWDGISNVTDWVLDKIRGFGSSILNGRGGRAANSRTKISANKNLLARV